MAVKVLQKGIVLRCFEDAACRKLLRQKVDKARLANADGTFDDYVFAFFHACL